MRTLILLAALVATPVMTQPAAEQPAVVRLFEPGPGSVNAYIVDAGSAVLIVDAQRSLEEGGAIAARVAETGKAVAGILITHPHPDHVGGLAALQTATEATIYGSSDTTVELGADTRKLLALAYATDPENTVAAPPGPDTIVDGGETVRLGDLDVEVIEFGPSEASNMTVYVVRALNAVFVGDLLNPGMTPFLLEKRTAAWLDQLAELERTLPTDMIAYPGHGEPGPLGALIAGQRAWLTDFRARVAEAMRDGVVSEAEAAKIAEDTPDLPPVAMIPDLTKRNVIAVTSELAGDPGAPPVATVEYRHAVEAPPQLG